VVVVVVLIQDIPPQQVGALVVVEAVPMPGVLELQDKVTQAASGMCTAPPGVVVEVVVKGLWVKLVKRGVTEAQEVTRMRLGLQLQVRVQTPDIMPAEVVPARIITLMPDRVE
jgi:hypothetical protein